MTNLTTHENKPVNIILVEDDEVDAKAVKRAFTRRKIANPVTRAEDGIEALEILRGENGKPRIAEPYILCVDLKMPRMGGIELIKEIRNDNALKSSIIFVLTTSKHDEDVVSAYNLNVAGYVLKENAGNDFMNLIDLLDVYWRIVEFPNK